MVVDSARLSSWAQEARRRTIELYADLSDRAMAVPYLRIINPPVWELGHVAWFQEHWVLRHALGQPPIHADGDALWNSAIIAHADRWTAPHLSAPAAPVALAAGPLRGDVAVPAGRYRIGAEREPDVFVFDNEKW